MDTPESSTESLEDQPTLGAIRVNHSVVASIVRLAALEIPGVCGVGAGIVDGLADLFSKRESDRGVKVSEDENGNYAIEIRVIVAFGTEIAKTAYQVQMAVHNQVEGMTGNHVKRVDVIIEGVKMISDKKTPEKTSEELWPETPHTD